jgi:WD40 repeat protein
MVNQADYRYDLFIAHSDADRSWVNGFLVHALNLPAGRVITRQNFRPGASLVEEFVQAVTTSRYTVLVLSPSYLDNEWATFGGQLAAYASVVDNRKRLIPLRRHPCRLPLEIDFLVPLDCTDQNDWEEEISRLRALLDLPEPKPEQGFISCPYPGMHPFSNHDADLFFARTDEIEDLKTRLRNQNYFFIIGPSGSGKSSLVFAGLIPELHKQQPPSQWLVRSMRPGADPMQALADTLGSFIVKDTQSAKAYTELIEAALMGSQPAQRFLLIIDQLEELFAQTEKANQISFITSLKCLLEVKECTLVLTMRADFYPELMNSPLWPLDSAYRLEIVPLQGDDLRKAIEKPAEARGVFLEGELTTLLLNDAAKEPGVLPLLQETMVLLWEKRQRHLLTLRSYEEMGKGDRSGLAVAIATKADATLALLDETQRSIARRIFLRLVHFGQGRADTRRQLPIPALRSNQDDPDLFDQTLRHLTNNRLLTLSGEERDADKKVDIAHEVLISGWPTLHKWVSEWREAEEIRRRLEDKAADWVRLASAGGGLLDDVELPEAEKWQDHPDAATLGSSEDLSALIKASQKRRKEAKERQRQGARLRNAAIVVLSILLVLTTVFGSVAYLSFQNAVVQTQKARSDALATEATLSLTQDRLDQALLLSVKATLVDNTLETRNSLLNSLEKSPHIVTILRHKSAINVNTLAFGPDNRMLISSDDDQVYIWDTKTRVPRVLPLDLNAMQVRGVAVSPDGRVLITASSDGVWFWDIQTGARLDQLDGKIEVPANILPRTSLAFSSDGTRVASARCRHYSLNTNPPACVETDIVVWNRLTKQQIGPPCVVPTDVNSITLSPHGTTLAYGSDTSVQLCNVVTGQPLPDSPLIGNTGAKSVAFSPNGKLLAAGSNDKTIRLWVVASRKPLGSPFFGQADAITSIAFSSDSRTLASGSMDKTIWTWDVASGHPIDKPLLRHTDAITSVAFSTKDQSLAAGGENGTVFLWNLDAESPISHRLGVTGGVWSAVFCPDGMILFTGSDDGKIFLYNMKTGKSLQPLDTVALYPPRKPKPGEQEDLSAIQNLAFSVDGQILASGRRDGTILVLGYEDKRAFCTSSPDKSFTENCVEFRWPDPGFCRRWCKSQH